MRRGDLVAVALPGDYGKPRPALVIQSDFFDAHPSVTVLPVTGELREAPLFRFRLEPSIETGLRKPSQVMIDKAMTVARSKLGTPFGRIDPNLLAELDRLLAVFLGIAK